MRLVMSMSARFISFKIYIMNATDLAYFLKILRNMK